jgi:hypothetical protein
MQAVAVVPEEVKGLNWSALILNWVWAIGNQVWIGLLALIPPIAPFVAVYLLIKGNELAWNGPRQWESVEQFKATQAVWQKWAIGVLILSVVLTLAWVAFVFFLTIAASRGAEANGVPG